ncbi:MAG: serine protease [Gammaproteobacteria bacterium]|nr:serine protease [Gammaproteobacteria bacterium]
MATRTVTNGVGKLICFNKHQTFLKGFIGVVTAALIGGSSWVNADSAVPDDGVVDDTVRIIGGSKAPAGKWPSMVALVNASGTSLFNRQFCGGTKVAERWVLTAAHCMFDFNGTLRSADSMNVVGDIIDLADASATEVVVSNIYVHPQYNNSAQNPINDIALLELGSDIDIDSVALYTQPQATLVNINAAIVGWGAVDLTNGQASYPTMLQEAVVPVVSQATCNAPESYNGFIEEGQVCAGFKNGGIDSCSGDSGGPLFVSVDGVTHQAGITSFGNGCAEPNFYGVYSEVAHFTDWLAQYLPEGSIDGSDPASNTGGIQQQVAGFSPSERSSSGAAWALLVLVLAGFVGRRRTV